MLIAFDCQLVNVFTWLWKSSMWSIRSRCEWNESTTTRGTFDKYSTMKPSVTSSGKRILSPMVTSRPLLASGMILMANARLTQNPAPPVANQNLIFWFLSSLADGVWCSKIFMAWKGSNLASCVGPLPESFALPGWGTFRSARRCSACPSTTSPCSDTSVRP